MDPANAIAFSDRYQQKMRELGIDGGKILNPAMGEYMMGFPTGWTAGNPSIPVGPKSAKLKAFSVFSGSAGLELGLADYAEIIGLCDASPASQRVLEALMLSGSLPRVPVFPDIVALQSKDVPDVDILVGGFPCQDCSVAGVHQGLKGSRMKHIGTTALHRTGM